MAVVSFISVRVLLLVSLCGISQAYFPYRPPCYNPGPRYDTCRDSIEDLKALVEVTQSLKGDNNYSCPSCANTFSEELILKLVNALIFTATYNCGYNGGNNSGGHGGHYPGGGSGGNSWGGHPTGPSTGGHPGGYPGGGHTGKSDGALINLGVLDGKDTVGLNVGNTKVLGVDVGPQSGGGGYGHSDSTTGSKGSDDGLINVGVLNKGNSLANVGLGGTEVLNVALGKDNSHGGSTGSPTPGHTGYTGNTGHTGNTGNTGHTGNPPLINVGVLDKGNSLANVGLGGTEVLNVALGKDKSHGESTGSTTPGQTGNPGNPPLVNVGVLDKGNSLVNVGLGDTDLLNVALGKDKSQGGTSGSTTPIQPGHLPGGSGPVSNGHGGATYPGNNAGTPPQGQGSGINPIDSNNQGGITNPANGGDVNQVNQSVTQVTNNIKPSH